MLKDLLKTTLIFAGGAAVGAAVAVYLNSPQGEELKNKLNERIEEFKQKQTPKQEKEAEDGK